MRDHETANPLVDAIRAKISREHGDDVRRLAEYYVELERDYDGPMIEPPSVLDQEDKSAA